MEDEIVESQDLQETPEDTASETVENETDDIASELDQLRAEKADLEAKNKQLYERTKKAEARKLEAPTEPRAERSDDLSGKDILALTSAKISDEEDIDLVQRAAKLSNKSLAEALKDPVTLAILKGRQEERQNAIATTSGSTRRAVSERKPSEILANAHKGKMPDTSEDTRKMVRASLGLDK